MDRMRWHGKASAQCRIVERNVLGKVMRAWEVTVPDEYRMLVATTKHRLVAFDDTARLRDRNAMRNRRANPRLIPDDRLILSLKNAAESFGFSKSLTFSDFRHRPDKNGIAPVAGKASANWRDAKGVVRAQIIIDTQDFQVLVVKNNFLE